MCRQKQYRLALCNPCFELWLLLHFADALGIDSRQCASAIEALRLAAGGYRKNRVANLELTVEMVHAAIARARQLEPNKGSAEEELPDHPVARFYLIIESLCQREAIDLGR